MSDILYSIFNWHFLYLEICKMTVRVKKKTNVLFNYKSSPYGKHLVKMFLFCYIKTNWSWRHWVHYPSIYPQHIFFSLLTCCFEMLWNWITIYLLGRVKTNTTYCFSPNWKWNIYNIPCLNNYKPTVLVICIVWQP